MSISKTQSKGFTIVELLIVIVVIAILAAITIVSYNGITNRSRQAVMQAEVDQIAKEVAIYKILNGSYPSNLNVLNNGDGPKKSASSQLIYTIEGDDFCLTIRTEGSDDAYHVCGNRGTVVAGVYSTHNEAVAQYPTRGGYIDMSGVYEQGTSVIPVNIEAIPAGSWMITVLAYNNPADATAPSGWTALFPRKATGSLQTSIFAKIKQAGDSATQEFLGPGANSGPYMNAVLVWGGNSGTISSWTLGAYGDRGVNATPTTVVTPSISVPAARSLILSIATERTTAAESNYVSLTGATPWVWIPQPNANKIQPIAIGYDEQASPGMSQAMTVTYPNAQSLNGTGVQIAIPPAS